MKYLVGVEGGGTKTNVAIADETGKILTRTISGPSNFLTIGIEKASENIIDGISSCLRELDLDKSALNTIMLGLTGAGRLFERNSMKYGFKDFSVNLDFLFENIIVDSDARVSLEAAFPNKAGMILIAGTGSIMFAKDEAGNTFRVGGWGRILGDEGSGYFISKRALLAVTRAIDGRGEKTLLTKLLDERFKLGSLETIVKAIYTDNFDIASISPTVFDAAQKNDKIAIAILDEAVEDLCLHIKTMVEKIQFKDTLGISFTGSILTNDNYVRTNVLNVLKDKFPFIVLNEASADPLEGAIIMAVNAIKH
jgi:N-acetylglucosamine kinase-like BadF-type ATPase